MLYLVDITCIIIVLDVSLLLCVSVSASASVSLPVPYIHGIPAALAAVSLIAHGSRHPDSLHDVALCRVPDSSYDRAIRTDWTQSVTTKAIDWFR